MTDSFSSVQAMRAVDPDIEVGAVGVGDRGAWSDWDDKVMKERRHGHRLLRRASIRLERRRPRDKVLGLPRRQWPAITNDVRAGYVEHSIDTKSPIAVTEHNLVASQDEDDDQLMAKAINVFYLAETIGQMATNGVTIANQWNLANGRGCERP